MKAACRECAREILETVPLVMRFIRGQVRRQAPAGLALPEFRTLIFLSRSREPSLSAVAGHLGLTLPAMSRMVGSLVRKGWVDRREVAADRRQIALGLTGSGRAALEQVRASIRRELERNLAILSGVDQGAIRRAMPALRKAFEPSTGEARKSQGRRS